MNRNLLRLGFLLVFLSFVTGLIIPLLHNPRLGVSAHLNALIGGIILVILGIIPNVFNLSKTLEKTMVWCWIYGTYMNWLATLLGGVWGTSKLTPIAGAGFVASVFYENVMSAMLGSLVLVSIIGCGIAIYGLRGNNETV